MKKIPIVVCTVGSPCLEVMKASIQTYAPDHPLIVHQGKETNFGDAYNAALTKAFKKYDEVIVANDDVVLNPETISKLLTDVEKLKTVVNKIGFVATLADNVRYCQNIRVKFDEDKDEIVYGKWLSEDLIKKVPVIAPIFAWFNKEAFKVAQFPSINWYSDDIICLDLEKAGYSHFISTAYIHHVGSSTVGRDYDKNTEDALVWIKKHRPDFEQEVYNRKYFNTGL